MWVCFKCFYVVCGRYIEDYVFKYFEEIGYFFVMEVWDFYVFCYLCKDYVFNDNSEGDLKLLRSFFLVVRG